MSWGIIGTWRMALEGIEEAEGLLKNGESSIDAIELAIKMVEDHPEYRSVGYGDFQTKIVKLSLMLLLWMEIIFQSVQ